MSSTMAGYSEEQALPVIETAAGRLGCELRTKQREVILSFVRGHDVFVSLPTGSGKSLCYSVLPEIFDILRKAPGSIILVISPLIALMNDQVTSLHCRNVKAVYIRGRENGEVISKVYEGQFQVMFCSPESLRLGEICYFVIYTGKIWLAS